MTTTQFWATTVSDYRSKPTDFAKSWQFLDHHPIFWSDGQARVSYFNLVLDIHVAQVCPMTRQIEDDPARNTATEIWLECGPVHWRSECPDWPSHFWPAAPRLEGVDGSIIWNCHDYELDCGGPTFEAAIIELAALVYRRYGTDRTRTLPYFHGRS